jgi:hypothetical protein
MGHELEQVSALAPLESLRGRTEHATPACEVVIPWGFDPPWRRVARGRGGEGFGNSAENGLADSVFQA